MKTQSTLALRMEECVARHAVDLYTGMPFIVLLHARIRYCLLPKSIPLRPEFVSCVLLRKRISPSDYAVTEIALARTEMKQHGGIKKLRRSR